MKRLLLLTFVFALLAPAPAQAKFGQPPLRLGANNRDVLAAQWLLGGHKPSVFRSKGFSTFKWQPNGLFGKRTAKAVVDEKWLLGYPLPAAKNAVFGRTLYQILTGQKTRPIGWIGRASQRAHQLVKKQRAAHASLCGRRVVAFARSQVGVHEVPDGSNYSRQIGEYEAITGARFLPWCVSFTQWLYVHAGVGAIADRTAGVFYAVDWARHRGWLRARPVVGAWIAFLHQLGHMGVVVAVDRSGVTTIEGNSGNAVRIHHYPLGYANTVYVVPPCLQ